MKISLRFYGNSLAEMTVVSDGTTTTEDITDVNGAIDVEFIQDLEDVVDELKNHNRQLDN